MRGWRRLYGLTAGDQRGSVFLAGLMLVAVMTLLGATLFDLSNLEDVLTSGDTAGVQSMYCAEAALNRTLNDNVGLGSRMVTIAPLVGTGGTLTFPADSFTLASGRTCTATVTFSDSGGASPQQMLVAVPTPPGGVTSVTGRAVAISLRYLDAAFEFAAVANAVSGGVAGAAPLHLRGTGVPNMFGGGGADVINGDVFIHGNVVLGEPSTGQGALINPFSVTDTRPTVSLPDGTSFTVVDNSLAFPTTGDPSPFGYRTDEPKPNVAQYLTDVKTALNITALNPLGDLVGTFKGSPVYNLRAIFDSTVGLGANADGTLAAPAGCASAVGASGKCKIYWDLKGANITKNPSDRSAENADTGGDDYYFDGTAGGELFASPAGGLAPKTGKFGATRYVDVSGFAQPPVFFADGNARFHHPVGFGFAVDGRMTIVASRDLMFSDNVMYMDYALGKWGATQGDTNLDPRTADIVGMVAGNDIWFGDPKFGTFVEGSGVMLAGRDFNYVFFKADGTCCRTPDNAVILNGTMLAVRQIAMLRDFVNPSDPSATCAAASDVCRPVAFDSVAGQWFFMTRAADGSLTKDLTLAPFNEFVCTTAPCTPPAGRRVITHFQMTVNYEARLRDPAAVAIIPPGLPTGAGKIYGGRFAWRECRPPYTVPGVCS